MMNKKITSKAIRALEALLENEDFCSDFIEFNNTLIKGINPSEEDTVALEQEIFELWVDEYLSLFNKAENIATDLYDGMMVIFKSYKYREEIKDSLYDYAVNKIIILKAYDSVRTEMIRRTNTFFVED